MFGLEPVGHPDPYTLVLHGNMPEKTYPLRKDFAINTRIPFQESKLPFFRVEGEGVFEIPVGPIHAGIIEPGHFRFSAVDDNIFYLDAKLFYTHKGTESSFFFHACLNSSRFPLNSDFFLNFYFSTGYCQAI